MKKILYFAMCCAAVAAVSTSCNKKAAATPGAAAKQYAEHIKNDRYDKFVRAIVFTEPGQTTSTASAAKKTARPAHKKTMDRMHANSIRTVNHPNVRERGGIKEVRLVSEKMSPDNKTCDVALTNHYNNGVVETVNYQMAKDNNQWKIKVNPYKEIWTATTNDGDREVMKVREGHERDFVKDNDLGERQFVKDITHRNGEVEVIKTLENGERSREVIKTLNEGSREIDKVIMDGNKVVAKDRNAADREIVKAKENVEGEHGRAREVIK